MMRMDLEATDFSEAIDQIPLKDVSRFVVAALTVRNGDPNLRGGLGRVIRSILPEAGLFLHENEGRPIASAICVWDGELAGLFEVATSRLERRRGHALRLILSALKWARHHGARHAWLQVEAANQAALSLYASLGFEEIYRYHYRRSSGASLV